MGAKVKLIKGSWTLVVHYKRRRQMRAIGPTAEDKRRAESIARKVNATIELGSFRLEKHGEGTIHCDCELDRWFAAYKPTFKPATLKLYAGVIENHLKPHYGDRDLRELREVDMLDFVSAMQTKGLGPKAIENSLSCLRRVCTLLMADQRLSRNPVANMGMIIRQVRNASATETIEREAWNREEARTLIAIARKFEPGFAPFLELLFATGLRKGEALGLKWADIDFDRRVITVRRSSTSAGVSTPKSGRSRRVPMTHSLAELLFDLLAERQRQRIENGWRETPEWVFCTSNGTGFNPRNIQRTFDRVRRRAQKSGVRPLSMHSARHSWATWALQAGKSVKWVAEVLGHADATMTLRVYAHAMPEDETDLSFAELNGDRRRYTATEEIAEQTEGPNYAESLVRREGLEPPTLRFEA